MSQRRQACPFADPSLVSPMSKPVKLSIVIPSVVDHEQSPLLASWRKGLTPSFVPQFVFLINLKQQNGSKADASIEHKADHDVVIVPSDRYFGSCEENIGRVADCMDLLGDYVVIVGEHDAIDWHQLDLAMEQILSNKLDALAVNISCFQLQEDGSSACLKALIEHDDSLTTTPVVKALMAQKVMSSRIGFPALISHFGPIDWAAYIGSHIYRREVLRRVFMYKTSEHVYSLVYKQAMLFCRADYRYSLFIDTPISRISNDFLKMKQGSYSPGWLENHRTVLGHSPCFWITNNEYIASLRDPGEAMVFIYSSCLSQVPGEDAEPVYRREYFLKHLLSFCVSALQYANEGRSYYLPEGVKSGSLADTYTVYRFLRKLMSLVENDYRLLTLHGPSFVNFLRRATEELEKTLKSKSDAHSYLEGAKNLICQAKVALSPETLCDLHRYSYSYSYSYFANHVSLNTSEHNSAVIGRPRLAVWTLLGRIETRLKRFQFKGKCLAKKIISSIAP